MQCILKLTVAAILLILPSFPLAPSWNTLCILYILPAFSSGSSWFCTVLPCLILTSPSTYSSQVIASTSWLQLLPVSVGLKPLAECCLYRNTLPSVTSLIHSTPRFTIHDNKEILKSHEGYFYLEEALLLPRDLWSETQAYFISGDGTTTHWAVHSRCLELIITTPEDKDGVSLVHHQIEQNVKHSSTINSYEGMNSVKH